MMMDEIKQQHVLILKQHFGENGVLSNDMLKKEQGKSRES